MASQIFVMQQTHFKASEIHVQCVLVRNSKQGSIPLSLSESQLFHSKGSEVNSERLLDCEINVFWPLWCLFIFSPPTLCSDVLSTSWKGEGSTRISSISIGLSVSASSHALICSSQWEARSQKWWGPPSVQSRSHEAEKNPSFLSNVPSSARGEN